MTRTQPLNTIIYNVRLWTGDATTPPTADAIGIRGDTIAIIGDFASVLAQRGESTQLIDGCQGLLTPGFTDSHCHFLDGGVRLLSVQLRDVTSRQEFTARVAAAAAHAPAGSWLVGGDWDHYSWGGELPDKSWIDAVTPEHPVWLNRMDGHMALANSFALKRAGISAASSGLLKEDTQNLVIAQLPPRSAAFNDAALEAAMSYVAARGVTSVQSMVTVDCACGLWPKNGGIGAEEENMDSAYEELEVYRRAQRAGTLRTRIHTALPLASWRRLQEEIERYGTGDDWLRIGGLKAMIDGSLGAHTAAMLRDYDDSPGDRGQLSWDLSILEGLIYDASAAGLQVMVHGIGDRGVRHQLDIFERVAARLSSRTLRFRIEHAQHIAPEDIPRFGTLGVIASLQMSHLADDGRWALPVIGSERMRTSWPMKSLLRTGAVVALGSDWFVTQPSPLEGIYAAVTRRTIDGAHPEGLVAEECVGVEDALRGYTLSAAFAVFEEARRGSLSVGKLADMVLLDQDILSISVDEIPRTQILLTMVGGKIVFSHAKMPEKNPF